MAEKKGLNSLNKRIFFGLIFSFLLPAGNVLGHSYIDLGFGLNATATADYSDQTQSNKRASSSVSSDGLALDATNTKNSNEPEPKIVEDSIEVKYKQPGRLLGLFPVTFEAEAITYADGHVEINYPWYTFFVVDNRSKVEAEIKEEVADIFSSNSGQPFSAEEKEKISARMRDILSTNLEADAEASLYTH